MNNNRYSCRRLVSYAVLFLLIFAVSHLAGFREYVNVLSGTEVYSRFEQFGGSLYLIGYFTSAIVAPVLLLAAGLVKLAALIAGKRAGGQEGQEP